MIQEKYLRNKYWDDLIILDACRYDYFKKSYRGYLSGDLQKVESAAEGTSPWVKKIFGQKRCEDIIYVSGNPHIASNIKIDGFLGGKHFYKVIDVWDWGWNSNQGTVPPDRVREAAKDARLNYPDKRLVIHFMQPHSPFPQLKSLNVRESPLGKIRSLIDYFGVNFMGRSKFRRIKESLWEPFWPYWKKIESQQQATLGTEAIAKKYGVGVLRSLYEKNLKSALEEVKNLLNYLSGKIIITADHGEALGGKEGFGHRKMAVPWLEVEREQKVDLEKPEHKRITARIGNLKRKGEI